MRNDAGRYDLDVTATHGRSHTSNMPRHSAGPAATGKRQRGCKGKLLALLLCAAAVIVIVIVLIGSGRLHLPIARQQEHAQEKPSSSRPASLDERARQAVSEMTLEQKVSQLFFVAPESLVDGVSCVTQAGELTQQGISEHPVGGVIFFAQNLEDSEQTRSMLDDMSKYGKQACGFAPFLGVDEEGGTVSRIGGSEGFDIANVGDMRAIGQTGDSSNARKVGSTVGTYLTKLGFTVDFAPVADIANNPESQTMARRSFGTTADVVSPMVGAEVNGLSDAGILSCAKHFPGIGGAVGDSHDGSIYSHKTFDEMAKEEFLPFKSAIEADVPFVMVGHLSCKEATGTDLPASLNPKVVSQLRDGLGFDGVIITDSLSMGAVSTLYSDDRIAVEALLAGDDMILMPTDFKSAYQGVLDAVDSGELSEQRIDESVCRIIRLKLLLQEGSKDQT